MSTPEDRFRRRLQGDVLLGTTPRGRDIHLDRELRLQHLYCIGRSGYGKTTMLRNLIGQDLLAGAGLAVLSPDDEMFRDHLLPTIPKHRIKDVIYVDPKDAELPVPLNPLHLAPGEDIHEMVDNNQRVLLRLVEGQTEATGAHRMQRILYHSLYTLTEIPGHTLLDMRRLLSRNDDGSRFRKSLLPRVTDPETRAFWTDDYESFPKDAHQAVLNRLGQLLTPPVRTVLCTPGACLNFRHAMDSGKILLFRTTATACKGPGNANVVGQFVVNKLLVAALSRDDTPESKRPFFPIYIDEFQNFCGADLETYRVMFSRTRKFHAPLTIAHLETGDFSESLVRHILGTVTTLVIFQTSYTDAKRLSRELVYRTRSLDKFGREQWDLVALDPKHLGSLPKYHAYAKVNGEVVRLKMAPQPRSGSGDIAREVVRHSRERYGVAPSRGAPDPGRTSPRPPEDQPPLDQVDPADPFS